jgi:hypothetical protein
MAAPLRSPKMEKPRPHICRTCDRSFTRLEHLKRHVRSHTKEKPFSCPHCASCFARRDLLLRHQRKLHQPVATSSTPRGARQEVITGLPPNITGPSKIADRTWKISVAGSVSGAADIGRESKRPRMGYVGVTTLGTFNELLWSRDASLAMNGEGYPDHSQHIGLNQSCVFDHRLMSTFLNRERQARPLPTSAAHLWDGCSGLQAVSSRGCGCDEFGWKGTFASSSSIVTPDQPHCLEANYKADRAVRKPRSSALPCACLRSPLQTLISVGAQGCETRQVSTVPTRPLPMDLFLQQLMTSVSASSTASGGMDPDILPWPLCGRIYLILPLTTHSHPACKPGKHMLHGQHPGPLIQCSLYFCNSYIIIRMYDHYFQCAVSLNELIP